MITVRTEKRVTYLMPGTFFSEEITRPIDDGSDLIERARASAPDNAFCFTVATVRVADPIDDEQGGTLEVRPRVMNRSGRYYLGGTVYTLAELERELGSTSTLVSNLNGNGWSAAIQTPFGNWQPFEEDAVLLEAIS